MGFQIIPRQPSFGERLGGALGGGLSQGISKGLETGMDYATKLGVEKAKKQEKLKLLNTIFGGGLSGEGAPTSKIGAELRGAEQPGQIAEQRRQEPSELSDMQIAALALEEPTLAKILQEQKREQGKIEREERKYHTEFSKKAEEDINKLRASMPRKEMSLDLARNAVESQDLSFFSKDKLADVTGMDVFRTAKGAQLITAAKENLLSNMSRVSARGQNIWFEQRLNSMFPKIGQSKEANLTVQEMLEGELAMDKAYESNFDRLVAEDESKYGFVRKDIEKRARDATKASDKEIFARTSYRIRELEDQEKGLSKLKQEAGKNVVKGTPLTLAMAKIYKDKFGDKALAVAKKNGYYIPSLEEYKVYRSSPIEFREQLVEE